MPNNYKYDTWEDAIDDAVGSAINDNSQPLDFWQQDILAEDNFDTAIKQAIKNIKDTPGLTITFKGEK